MNVSFKERTTRQCGHSSKGGELQNSLTKMITKEYTVGKVNAIRFSKY